MGETQEKITDINIIANVLKDKLAELNADYELQKIVFKYTTDFGYMKDVTVVV